MTIIAKPKSPPPTPEWKAKANAEYQKVIGSVITLFTAALVVPTLFLKDYLGVAGGVALLPRLTASVYCAWVFLLLFCWEPYFIGYLQNG
jgi:hypothetical protein